MSDKETKTSKKWALPKFDSTPWLLLGVAFSLFLTLVNLWALIARWHDAFFPFQLGKLLGVAIGIALGLHCADMIRYYRKHGRLRR